DELPPADGQRAELEAAGTLPAPPPDLDLGEGAPGVLTASIEDAIGRSPAPAEPGSGVLASDGLAAARASAKPPDDQWVLGPTPAYPPAAPAASPDPQFVDYSVREGDSMWTIADSQLGDPSRWGLIADANPTIDPERLRVGQRIRIPTKPNAAGPILNAPARLPVASSPQPAAGPTKAAYYTVRSGDTLSRIAQLKYQNAAKWRAIYDANQGAIGFDPDRLEVGMRLRIPPA
ncbi:MAG: LysM peptidoglycan-binding domain-containing protein, partial [Planctomycetota bacterium]